MEGVRCDPCCVLRRDSDGVHVSYGGVSCVREGGCPDQLIFHFVEGVDGVEGGTTGSAADLSERR